MQRLIPTREDRTAGSLASRRVLLTGAAGGVGHYVTELAAGAGANSVLTLYSATKATVHNLARTLTAALSPRGIRVNSVSTGYIDTPLYPSAA